jgi:hypothetical protein
MLRRCSEARDDRMKAERARALPEEIDQTHRLKPSDVDIFRKYRAEDIPVKATNLAKPPPVEPDDLVEFLF